MPKPVITVQGFTPHKSQKELIDICLNKRVKYITACVGRQWGKSFLGLNLMTKWMLENPKSVGMWVSPVYNQGKKVFEELTNILYRTKLTKTTNKSELTITFVNGSKLYFRSAEREDNLRGFTLTHLVVDEAAYIKDSVWDKVLRPMVLVKGEKVLFLSTPKGKNWFYNMAMKGYDPLTNHRTYHGSSYDSPYISEEELNDAKLSLPEAVFRQEIMAEFIDSGGEVFSDLHNSCVVDFYPEYDPNGRYYAGLDFGRQEDYTVLTILNQDGMVVDFYRSRQKSWDIIISEILVKLRKWKPVLYSEINGIGDPIFEQIKKKYSNIHPFITTMDSKQNLIEDLIMNLNEGKIRLPTKELNPDLYHELSIFTYQYNNKTRKVRYGAPPSFHDDCVMSLAMANFSLKSKVNYGSYVVR